MKVSSCARRLRILSTEFNMGRKGASYKPAYADTSTQPTNSRHQVNRNSRSYSQTQGKSHGGQNVGERNSMLVTMDSRRSECGDTSNIQQMNGHTPNSSPDDMAAHGQQWQDHIINHNLNPLATTFQPSNPTQSYYTPYHPLRISNGLQERNVTQQARSISTSTYNPSGRRYNFRSRGSAQLAGALQDVALPSIEQQARHSSSIPAVPSSRRNIETLRGFMIQRSSRSATPPVAPVASKAYVDQAFLEPEKLLRPQKLLVIVDLNGTLVYRGNSRTNVTIRPGVDKFLDYLFKNHIPMIYTSTRPENASKMVENLMSVQQRKSLAAVWARDKLDLTSAQYNSKVQVYKKLEKIWSDADIQKKIPERGLRWDQTNTVLIDDSHVKALAQPYNLLRVEEFVNNKPVQGMIKNQAEKDAMDRWTASQEATVKDLERKLEELKWTADVSRVIRRWQLESGDAEKEIADALTMSEEMTLRQVGEKRPTEREKVQLPTPKSPDDAVSTSDESDGGVDSRQVDLDDLVRQIDRENAIA